jgi:hypothetical protein
VPTNWVVVPTCLPTIVRRCHACPSQRFRAHGKFRVNANHKLLDAWLLALCTTCGDTTKLTVFERTHVRSVRPELRDGAWCLDTGGSVLSGDAAIDVSVRFAARIPVQPVRLMAEGLGLPRAQVERLLSQGRLTSAVRLQGKRSGDFTFTLTC